MRNYSVQGAARGSFLRLTFLILGVLICSLISVPQTKIQAASSVKIRYNGKTHKNKSKKMTVKYNGKTVSKKSYKALIIKKKYMVSYTDVFKKGVKAKCKYKKSKKSLSISANGVTLVMTVGKRKAKLNGKKVTLPVAPLSVRYVSKKKTKILVPINYVAKTLHLSYKKSGSTIMLGAPLLLTCDNVTTYYTGVQGNIFYNHKLYNLKNLPVIKVAKNMYMPAEETIKNIMGLDYEYNASKKEITISNEDTDKDYTRGWNKSANYYQIQSKEFFSWEKTLSQEEKSSTTTNTLHKFSAVYLEQGGTGSITFRLSGTLHDILKTATVNRSGNVITATIPKSDYILDKHQFNNFGEIVQKMDITEKEDSVVISFQCMNVADFSYITQNGVLEINILYTYGSKDGSVISYSLSIPKPAGVTMANVSNEDLYTSKTFKVYINGDHTAFYQNNPIIINNSNIKNLTVTRSGANTVITITTASLSGYKIFDKGDCFQIKMGTPKKIYKNIVVLDAGHGGHDPGAQSRGTNEKDLTFKILYTLMKNYFSDNAPDTKVYWTRTNDSYISLANRAAFAKTVGADVFISLHMNSAANTSANGTEVYYSISNNSKGFSGITSQKMANLFKTRLVNDLKTKSRGTKSAAYYVLKHNTVPAILIELGFISGNSDYGKLTNPTFQNNAAKSIYNGIMTLFATYPTGR